MEVKINTTSGSNSSSGSIRSTPKWVGRVTADKLNVRTWAGKEYPIIKSWSNFSKNNLVDVCDTEEDKMKIIGILFASMVKYLDLFIWDTL